MIKGLRSASIWSEDIGNLLPFYRDIIGLPVTIGAPGFAVLGNLERATVNLGTHSEVQGKNADPARHTVGLESDDVEADYQRLAGQGVEFIEKPTEMGEVTVATFKDPDGNYIQLVQFR